MDAFASAFAIIGVIFLGIIALLALPITLAIRHQETKDKKKKKAGLYKSMWLFFIVASVIFCIFVAISMVMPLLESLPIPYY